MAKNTFLKDKKTKLYYIKNGKQLITITESRCLTLFNYLYANWQKIEVDYLKKKEKITLFFNEETFTKLVSDLTKLETKVDIGFSTRHIIVSIEQIKEKEPVEEKEYITIRKAAEITGKSQSTIRNQIIKDIIPSKKEKIGKNKFRYLIESEGLIITNETFNNKQK